ncbi:phosphate ABC transporter substrate-binding protein [Mycoplasma sp. NEAQ87857]|uniref:PstS family phosphate ABC transporter substrate-binding protein n=1 Tax=Mycoplasma sp. NEAQ87857 TaxID=2683967 RepID=UPI0013173D5B|nr:substrate-binding domain-containing protein [Mycoplasma sp. NEAQ87857]QGZ97620.1 phosphate ABC transporter substrate-binding protein [Mycoplasma sp. NEAQ87857]
MKTNIKKTFKKKNFLFSLALAPVVGAVVLFASTWQNAKVVTASGSSAVQPFFDLLAKQYINESKKNIEISVQAGGSGTGINNVARNKSTIGLSSKSPSKMVKSSTQLQELWTKNKLKTITIAHEGIVLIAKLPKDVNLTINQNNIAKIYQAFSGNEQVFINDLIKNPIRNNFSLKPFAREGGGSTSGTAQAFYEDNGFKNINLPTKVKDILQGKQNYGPYTTSTSESNSQTYELFAKDGNQDGSITYLSLGYVLNNKQKILNDGFTILSYEINDQQYQPTVANIQNNLYNWKRPIDLITSINNYGQRGIIEWILFDDSKTKTKIFNDNGMVPLSLEQLSSMFYDLNSSKELSYEYLKENLTKFWVDDNQLKSFGVNDEQN